MLIKASVVFSYIFLTLCSGEFIIPEVNLEAYDPKGFRASIPALEGIHIFAFHANINKEISQVEPGDYNGDFTKSENNMFSYYNPDVVLKSGDTVYYWIFVQHDKLGYRRDNQRWNVRELVKIGSRPCVQSITSVAGKTLICKDHILFEDNFDQQSIDTNKWTIEQYIPTYKSLDYEFVSYQNRPDVCYIRDSKLFIKPQIESDNNVNNELDLRSQCTRNSEEECFIEKQIYFVVPSVTSGRIVSHFKFRYGKIEIKAKLPSGDWIFPQVYLEQVSDNSRKLWVAYARGNDKLTANNQEDIGGKLLFGGPILDPSEQERTQYLKSKQNNIHFTKQSHTYTVYWKPDSISLEVDGVKYGEIDNTTMDEIKFSENDMVRIVLGVGVGGVNDFPDGIRTGEFAGPKPWRNNGNKQVRDFFNSKPTWMTTWRLSTDNRALQVESVKVWAL